LGALTPTPPKKTCSTWHMILLSDNQQQPVGLGWRALSRALVAPVYNWRTRRIAQTLGPQISAGETVLDFGAGDGEVARAIVAHSGCRLTGLDTITYGDIGLDFVLYDGHTIPLADDSFDTVMALFVLHHCTDPDQALAECRRVSRRRLLIVEEVYTNRLEALFTSAEDWVTNRLLSGDVDIPLNFRSLADWRATFRRLGLAQRSERTFRPLPFIPLRTVLFELEK